MGFRYILFRRKTTSYNVMSQTLTIMSCLGGKGSEKEERESDKERILISMVVQSGENVPF